VSFFSKLVLSTGDFEGNITAINDALTSLLTEHGLKDEDVNAFVVSQLEDGVAFVVVIHTKKREKL
jgi:hypothetical protein